MGAYAIQRLSPKPFKTTFGNLRISDIVPDFIAMMRKKKAAGEAMTAVDGGDWLMDWLETDVIQAIEKGRDYSNNVPFKSSHLPKDSGVSSIPRKSIFAVRWSACSVPMEVRIWTSLPL